MTIRKAIQWISFLALLALSAPAAQKPDPAEGALRTAMDKETLDGDLKAAAAMYRKIITAHKDNRAVVAKALVRLGQCAEKSGEAEARQYYERIIREFGDQKDAAEAAQARLAALGSTSFRGTGVTMTQLPFGLDNDVGRVSPDGRFYVFAAWDTTGDLTVRDLQTTEHRRLTNLGWPKSGEQIRSADWCGDSKQILYAWGKTNERVGGELRTIRADGTGGKTVLRLEGSEQVGVFSCSANGDKALVSFYKSERSPQIDMGIVDMATGSWQTLRLPGLTGLGAARLSPDGKWIAYQSKVGPPREEFDLRLAAVDGGADTLVSGGPGFDGFPEWTADGKRLLFISERTGLRLLWSVAVSDGKLQGEPRALSPSIVNSYVVGLSQDGSLFLTRAHSNNDLYEVAFDPAAHRAVGEPSLAVPDGRGRNRKPSLSPDGEQLAFMRRADPGRDWTSYNVIVRSMKSGGETVLPVKTSYWFGPPAWSSDGKTVSVRTFEGDVVKHAFIALATGQVRTVDLSEARSPLGKAIGSGKLPVPGGARFVTVSPDDRWVAYVETSSTGSGDSLYVLSAAGDPPREVVRPETSRLLRPLALLKWNASSDRIYFGAAESARAKTQVWTVPLAGGQPQATGLYIGEGITFSPDGKRAIFGVSTDATNELWVMRNLPLR